MEADPFIYGFRNIPNHVDERIAAFLVLLRKHYRLSQKDLGKLIGVSYAQVQKYESCQNRLPAARLHELCRIYNLPQTAFFRDYRAFYSKDTPTLFKILEDENSLSVHYHALPLAKKRDLVDLVEAFCSFRVLD